MAEPSIRIPKLNVDAPIVEIPLANSSWDVSSLDGKVGRLEGTANFDAQDNVVLTGFSLTAEGMPGIFADLHTLVSGDEVIVVFNGEERRYKVGEARRVRYDDFSILDTSQDAKLTLITAAVDSYDEDEGEFIERHVIVAQPEAAAAPAETPSEEVEAVAEEGEAATEEGESAAEEGESAAMVW